MCSQWEEDPPSLSLPFISPSPFSPGLHTTPGHAAVSQSNTVPGLIQTLNIPNLKAIWKLQGQMRRSNYANHRVWQFDLWITTQLVSARSFESSVPSHLISLFSHSHFVHSSYPSCYLRNSKDQTLCPSLCGQFPFPHSSKLTHSHVAEVGLAPLCLLCPLIYQAAADQSLLLHLLHLSFTLLFLCRFPHRRRTSTL